MPPIFMPPIFTQCSFDAQADVTMAVFNFVCIWMYLATFTNAAFTAFKYSRY